MGLRSKIKGKLKAALGGQTPPAPKESPTQKHMHSISEDTGRGNLRDDDDDVPWYLKYDDADGWESTNANDVDED